MRLSLFILLAGVLGWDVVPTAVTDRVAVVEYFTSEGCSGCPRADHLLGRLLEEDLGENVIFLSFHVDHFDTPTWQDPYSNPLFSARQRGYSLTLGEALFTPQMVVNGTDLRIGSREHEVRGAIAAALDRPVPYQPAVRVQRTDAGVAVVDYSLSEGISNAVVNIALVEATRPRQSPPYQLDGRTLAHENVVRRFQTVWGKPGQHKFTLALPDDLNATAASVVVYLQDATTMQVLGATGTPLG
ncbi:MAG: DUF1223 domain-containing protein [Bacteroidota bacterium]